MAKPLTRPTIPKPLSDTFFAYELNRCTWTGYYSGTFSWPSSGRNCKYFIRFDLVRQTRYCGPTTIRSMFGGPITAPMCDSFYDYVIELVGELTMFVKDHDEFCRQVRNQTKIICHDSTPLVIDVCDLIAQFCDDIVRYEFIDEAVDKIQSFQSKHCLL